MLPQDLTADSTKAAAVTAGVACGLVAVGLLVKTLRGGRDVTGKIERARGRRAEDITRAEKRVRRYMETHPIKSSSIVRLSLSELREKLQEGCLSPEDVLHSYMEQALVAHGKLNCCTDILVDCFEQLETLSSNKDGLLYGVPISLKENISYKNHDNTCGLVLYLDKPAPKDSVLVQVLKKQGAIPFVKTNIPQALLSYDCSNPIYGETVNPHNTQKSPGGSSGGEGALIAAGGSVLGIGTDIGGSIRLPASFCGICGLKTTAGRLSTQGIVSILRGQKSVRSTVGPMARDVDSLAVFMQAVLSDYMFALDPTVPPIPFNMQIYQSTEPLRIGYLENDGYTHPTPSMARSLREVKALLEKAGHTLVPYEPLKMEFAMPQLVTRGLFADGGATLLAKLKGGPLDPGFAEQTLLYRLPKWLKRTMAFLLSPWSPRFINTRAVCGVGSVEELWEHHAEVEEYVEQTIANWRKSNIDVLLCPALGPALKPGESGKIPPPLSLSILYNLLNFPAGIVPVSTVTAEDEEEMKHYKGNFQDKWDRLFKQAVQGGEGLPVAVQCVALPWRDELCLRFMREVEKLVRESRK